MTSTPQATSSRGLFQTIDRWAGIRADERRLAYGAFMTQLLIGAGHAELETARDTVFLSRLSPAQLPIMYLAVALLGFLMTEFNRRSMLRQRTRGGLTGFLVLGGLISAGFALLEPSTPVIYALYLWTALCGPWAVLQFSLQLATELSVEQAKRLLGFVGAGAVLGAVVGSGLARVMLEFATSRSLVVSAGVFFVLAGTGPSRMAVAARVAERGARREAYRTTRTEASSLLRDRYGRGLLILMMSSTIALTFADYFFKAEATRALTGSHRLGEFLSTTQVVTNLVSLFVQIFAVAGILRALGAHGALLVLPTFLLGGTAVLGSGAGLLGALVLRGADGSLRYSVHRTALDILYFPLPDSARRRMKPVLEIMGQRGGQALAALLLLGVSVLPLTARMERLGLIALMVSMLLVWSVAALRLRRPYVDLFKSSLAHSHDLSPTLTDRELALPVLEAAVASLNSQRPPEVITALSLLSNYREGRLLPALILYHPEPVVLVRALDLFAQVRREDVLPLVDRLLAHEAVEVRTAALRTRMRVRAEESMLRRFVTSSGQPELAATALVGAMSNGWIGLAEAEARVAAWAADERADFVRPLAQAAQVVTGTPELAQLLAECLGAAKTQVEQAEVAAALARNPCPSSQKKLVALLAYRIPRESVRDALVALGQPALDELTARLEDVTTPHAVRRHLPETIRRFPTESAVKALQAQLVRERDGMVRFKLLRSLNRLRRIDASLPLDESAIDTLLQETLEHVARSIRWREALRAEFEPKIESREAGPPSTRFTYVSPSLELLIEVLHDKEAQATERALRLCNLLLPREDFRPIAVGLRSRIPTRRATAFEVLSSSLPLKFRDQVLDIVRYTFPPPEANESDERIARPFTDDSLTGEVALRQIVREEGVTLRALALNAAAEIGYPWVEDAFEDAGTPHGKPSAVKLYEAAKAMHVVSSRPSLPTLDPEPT